MLFPSIPPRVSDHFLKPRRPGGVESGNRLARSDFRGKRSDERCVIDALSPLKGRIVTFFDPVRAQVEKLHADVLY